jgi:hypothetical protein
MMLPVRWIGRGIGASLSNDRWARRRKLMSLAPTTLMPPPSAGCWVIDPWRRKPLIDHLCRVIATAGVSLTVFFTGLSLIYVFYYLIGWAPSDASTSSSARRRT